VQQSLGVLFIVHALGEAAKRFRALAKLRDLRDRVGQEGGTPTPYNMLMITIRVLDKCARTDEWLTLAQRYDAMAENLECRIEPPSNVCE